ncbi:Gldg family protein [Roseibacillus ishigakijimensis]|uniref:Gldg family protein n=1 Tax=Roseibacillus ishigakijimensis TaxID=454146 RepID=A0A934RUX7_9BACT|nr:Gldg family protein [Roseibacillus ishigakijimensis]MBK1835464.1 Gldg family protein [Roseibacillus ishigakijimensis]
MSSQTKAHHPVLTTVLGIVALVLIAFFANWLVSLSTIGNRTLDLTEDKVHTLTPGTKAILEDLKESEAEVVINYYATRDAEFMPRNLELYMKKVDGLLKRYQSLAGDNLRIVNLDPKPDTDAEDSANLDGIAGQSINGENLYLGLSVSFLDEKAAIPYLAPEAETQLEYQLSSAIARVARTDRPTLGIMSALPLGGGPAMMPGQMPGRPFVIYQQLQQMYEIKDLGMTPTAADLDGLAAVLVIHPAGISEETEYRLDQYLLAGGTIVAALDAFSITAQQTGGGNPMMGQAGTPTSSTFSDQLLDSWGVQFVSHEVVADGNYRTQFRDGASTSALSLTRDALPQKDNLITSNLNNLFFVLAGAFTPEGKKGLEHTSLVRTTRQAGFVDGMSASRLDPRLLGAIRQDDKAYDLALHVQGHFQTAFPDGDPTEVKAEEENTEENEEESAVAEAAEAEEAADEEKPAGLTESSTPGNVFLIADSDFIGDNFAYQQVFGGMFAPQGDNVAFLLNILDQVTGSKHLIGSRSRNDSRRPFTVIQDMETEFEQKFGEERDKAQNELDQLGERLQELIQAQQQNGRVALEGEVKEEYDKVVAKQVEARQDLRELEKDLRRKKDQLATRYTLANLFIVPGIVILIGLAVFLKRRLATSAR